MGKPAHPWRSLVVLCLGTFAVLLDATIVNVALPSVITDLHASLDQALWVVNAYLLVFAALLIVAGRPPGTFGPPRPFSPPPPPFAGPPAPPRAAPAPGRPVAPPRPPGRGAGPAAP